MNYPAIKKTALEQLDIQDLPSEARDQILSLFGENAMKAITIAIFDRLEELAKDEFTRLLDRGDEAAIEEFLRARVPDLDSMVETITQKEIAEFKKLRDAVLAKSQ